MISKFIASLKKEALLLISDKAGLAVMFLMPVLLVFIMTIVQDGALKLVNENKVSLLISNQDEGEQGKKLVKLLMESGLFTIETSTIANTKEFKKKLLNDNALTALYIPKDFSSELEKKSNQISQTMTFELGLREESPVSEPMKLNNLNFYTDPILQENYSYSIIGVISSFMNAIESELMIESIYAEVGMEGSPDQFKDQMKSNQVIINHVSAANSEHIGQPNSTQHNVPAWTIFAMFFMVVSLGGNIVKERMNGSFLRLKTMPTSYIHILSSKMVIFMFVALLQFSLIFSLGMFVFPLMSLPPLVLPSSISALLATIFMCSLAAVSYAIMVGALAKTQEQSNGIGAVTIIIFSALGGIWVPTFVMPEYLQTISKFSPMHWCLDGFYTLFLKDGSWGDLLPVFGFLLVFSAICQAIIFIKLKFEKLI